MALLKEIQVGSTVYEICDAKSRGTASSIWPVGSIYLSVTPTNPSEYWGGTWVALAKGYALWTADPENATDVSSIGTTSAAESTGGTQLQTTHLPSHTHKLMNTSDGYGFMRANGTVGQATIKPGTGSSTTAKYLYVGSSTDAAVTDNSRASAATGDGTAHSHTGGKPARITIFAWQKTAD